MGRIFLISDTHFSHSKIIEYGRPKDYEYQIKKHLKLLVDKTDTLIHLGDICIGNDKENSNWFKRELGCKTILVKGNHDGKSYSWYLDNGWDFVCREFVAKYFGKVIVFSHIPFLYDKERYDLNIHGHLHDRIHRDIGIDYSGRNFHLISMEFSNYTPILLNTILSNQEPK